MKNTTKLLMAFLAIGLIFSACDKNEVLPGKEIQINSQEIAENIVGLLNDKTVLSDIIGHLESNKFGSSLENVLQRSAVVNSNEKSRQTLSKIVSDSKDLCNSSDQSGVVEIPELWMFKPKISFKSSDVLVAYIPEGDDKDWKSITAYDLDGNIVYLDPKVEPSSPVIVVELNGMESLKQKVKLMNKELKNSGLQKRSSLSLPTLKATGGLETTKITKLSLKDDKEPWIKGAAEIYAITSGIRGTNDNKEAEIAIVAMPYLDYDNSEYFPNQVILFWDDYAYQAANIQLYEQDSNYNYKELVGIIVAGVFEITGILTAEPWVTALGTVASAIIEVMPDEWYTDNDDYIDSYYTIMKDKTYTDYFGAGGNAKMTCIPFLIPEN